MTDEFTFEDALKGLEEIVEQLEDGETTLDESLRLFERGVGLAKRCQRLLDEAESRIEILVSQNGRDKVEAFPEMDDEVEVES